ncbi:MAG: division/cell wall cluster transcriptional repressor MraZ [Pseudomonadota bacterium]
MFRGLSALAVDGKGRLAIPTKYRELLMERCGGRLVVTADPSGCLLLYPFPEWEPIERKLTSLSSFNPVSRQLQRILVGSASDVELDSAGRILLPPMLRKHANLEKEAMLVGQGNKFEIWSEPAWQAQYETAGQLPELLGNALQNGELPDELKGFSL